MLVVKGVPAMKLPRVNEITEKLDQKMNVILTSKDFLKTASVVINLNSYRRKWTRTALQRALTTLELPVRTDQERMLAMLEQLGNRIEDLESQLHARQ
jgi:hypothetical protein